MCEGDSGARGYGQRMPGVVSLLPSATEWVYALGQQHRLQGVTFECDEPAGARTDHRVVVTGLETSGLPPGEIDALVRSRVADDLPLYCLDDAAMSAIAPDVVLTQDLCRVCALPAAEVDRALAAAGCPSVVVTLDPHRLEEVLEGAIDVAAALGVPEAGAALRQRLSTRLASVAESVVGHPRARVLVLEWTDPPFVAGHWVPDLVTAAGGEPVLAAPGGRSSTTTWAEVERQQADVVLVAPCGFGLDDAIAQAEEITERLPRGADVWAVDAGGLVTRPGPRVVDGVEAIAHALHPELVPAPPAGRVALVRSTYAGRS